MTTMIRPQRGATLLVALIMLVLLTLFAITAFNTGTTNLKVVGNMQARTEALNATQQAIETVISTPLFVTNPTNAVLNPCGAANTLCTDVTGDGIPEYTTKIEPPKCVRAAFIKVADLNLSNPEDLACAAGQAQQFGIAGAVAGDSLCGNTHWDVTAETTSPVTGAKVKVTQGVGLRTTADELLASCL